MKKSRLMKVLSVLLFIGLMLVGTGCSRTYVAESSKDDKETATPKEETGRKVVITKEVAVPGEDYSFRVDCIRDEELPLNKKADYNTFTIYRVEGEEEEKVYTFDDKESFEREEYFTGLQVIENFEDLNGHLLFTLAEDTMGSTRLLLIGEDQGRMKIKFFDEYNDSYSLADNDGDGSTELMIGSSNGGGYVSWWNGFLIAYSYKDGGYTPTYALTKQYYNTLVNDREKAFLKDKTYKKLQSLLEACVFMGDEERVSQLILEYPDLIGQLNKKVKTELETPYEEFTAYQAANYKTYWDEIFTGDTDYEKDKEADDEKESQAGSKSGEDADPFVDKLRSLGDSEVVLYNLQSDIDLDGFKEAILATGTDNSIANVYLFRQSKDQVKLISKDFADGAGYGIYEVGLVTLQDQPQSYIYCGLTNGGSMNGFILYELRGNDPVQLAYSASPTGSGDDVLIDSDKDGLYDGYVQYRQSYDVMYYPTNRLFLWKKGAFIHQSTHVELPAYPTEVKEVVMQFVSLFAIDDGLSPEITERLGQLCTVKTLPQLDDVWYGAAMDLFMGFEDKVPFEVNEKENEAEITLKCDDTEGKAYQLKIHLSKSEGQWHIDKIEQ